jgi:hypothetical protein
MYLIDLSAQLLAPIVLGSGDRGHTDGVLVPLGLDYDLAAENGSGGPRRYSRPGTAWR